MPSILGGLTSVILTFIPPPRLWINCVTLGGYYFNPESASWAQYITYILINVIVSKYKYCKGRVRSLLLYKNMRTGLSTEANFTILAKRFCSCSFILGATSIILQLANFQEESFYWLVGFVFLVAWIEVEAPLHSFSKSFDLKPDRIFICLSVLVEWY